jgi:CBS domain-containing protein
VDRGYAAAIPLAIGAAVSPGLLAIVLLILSSEQRPKARAWFYLFGVVTVMLLGSLVGIVTVRALVEALGTPPTSLSVTIKAAVTIVLLGLGWRSTRTPSPRPARRPPWLESRLRAARPPLFFVLGVATMLTNWSTLLLYLSALEIIRATAASTGTTLLASGIALLITLSPLLLPVLAVTIIGHRSDRLLSLLGRTAGRHAHQIIAGIYVVIAAIVAVSALNEMASP